MPWVMLRMMEYLSACLASSGSSSPMHDAVHVGGDRLVQRAAVVVARLRLRIEGVEVRRAAPHPDLDDRLGLGRRCGGRAAADARAAASRPPPRPDRRIASRRE